MQVMRSLILSLNPRIRLFLAHPHLASPTVYLLCCSTIHIRGIHLLINIVCIPSRDFCTAALRVGAVLEIWNEDDTRYDLKILVKQS